MCNRLRSVCRPKLKEQDQKEGDGLSMRKDWVQPSNTVRKSTDNHQRLPERPRVETNADASKNFKDFNELQEIV